MPRTYSELYISVRNRLRDAGIEAAELEGKLIVATAAGKTTEKLLRDMRFYATDEVERRVDSMLRRRLAGEPVAIGMMGALPSRPPNSSSSPSFLPMAGIMRTAVVLELTIPMAASSAMIAAITSAGVSPGQTIMSSPTEQTQVIASSFSRVSAPACTASIMP